MSDLFHQGVPDSHIEKVFEVMLRATHHVFQLLTKRPARMVAWTRKNFEKLPRHIWLGTTVESQPYVGRICQLQMTPAQVRFLSLEPLIGPLQLDRTLLEGIHWAIVGGESGHGARPMKAEWVHAIRSECQKYSVPFFFKQWGAYNLDGERVGKKVSGRVLDGRTWDAKPVYLQNN
jgi:protein gp37